MKKIQDVIKKLSSADKITIAIFTAGFLLAVADMKMLTFFEQVLKVFSNTTFIVSYIVLLVFLHFEILIMIKNIAYLRVTKPMVSDKDYKGIAIKLFEILCVSFTIGVTISLANAFVIEGFNRLS